MQWLAFGRPDCSVHNPEGVTDGENGSSDADADVIREGRNSSGSCGYAGSQCGSCGQTYRVGGSSQDPIRPGSMENPKSVYNTGIIEECLVDDKKTGQTTQILDIKNLRRYAKWTCVRIYRYGRNY